MDIAVDNNSMERCDRDIHYWTVQLKRRVELEGHTGWDEYQGLKEALQAWEAAQGKEGAIHV